MRSKALDATALTIAIIGAVNWGLIGFFDFDLVAFLFGSMSWISRIVYALVGLSGLYLLTFYLYLSETPITERGQPKGMDVQNRLQFRLEPQPVT